MLTSMTGFGRGSASAEGFEVVVEVRSVNSRYAEISARLPRSLSAYESEVQSITRSFLERGRINVQVEIGRGHDDEPPLAVDADAVATYARLLGEIRAAAGIEAPVALAHLLQFSDLIIREPREDEAERLWAATRPALEEALRNIVRMRRQEGEALGRELHQRVALIEEELRAVEARAPKRVDDARSRLHERLAEILSDDRIDRDRLELEIAVAADRLDITEECVRLRSHLELFREAIDNDESVGRKLNFISQEINREVNTIGSKANDAEIARRVVVMKEELEKMREQIQNVE